MNEPQVMSIKKYCHKARADVRHGLVGIKVLDYVFDMRRTFLLQLALIL